MRTREEALEFGLSLPDTYQDAPFHDDNWQLVRVKGSGKAFLWTYERNGFINLNVKVSPEWRDLWRDIYEAVVPGWHQNKENWNTIILDGSVPTDEIKRMIAESYDLVADSATKRIYEAVKRIPKGCVATYGQVAWRRRLRCLLGKASRLWMARLIWGSMGWDEIQYHAVFARGRKQKDVLEMM